MNEENQQQYNPLPQYPGVRVATPQEQKPIMKMMSKMLKPKISRVMKMAQKMPKKKHTVHFY